MDKEIFLCKYKPKKLFSFAYLDFFNFFFKKNILIKRTDSNNKEIEREITKVEDEKEKLKIKFYFSFFNFFLSFIFLVVYIYLVFKDMTYFSDMINLFFVLPFLMGIAVYLQYTFNLVQPKNIYIVLLIAYIVFIGYIWLLADNIDYLLTNVNLATIFFISVFFFTFGFNKMLKEEEDDCICKDNNFYYICEKINEKE